MRLICLVFVLLAPWSYAEEKSQPPWLQPNVVKAAVQMNMTEEQIPLFREALGNLINNQLSATNRVLRGNNVSNLERKLKTATNRQFKKMDKAMLSFLTEEQHENYYAYRKVLKSELTNGALSRGAGNSADINAAGASLDGFSEAN